MIDLTKLKTAIPRVLSIITTSLISCALTYMFIAKGVATVDTQIVRGEKAYSSIKTIVETETSNYLKEKTETVTTDDIADLSYKVNKALESTNVNLNEAQKEEIFNIVNDNLKEKKISSASEIQNISESIGSDVSDLAKQIDENDRKIADLIGSYDVRKREVDKKVNDLNTSLNSLRSDEVNSLLTSYNSLSQSVTDLQNDTSSATAIENINAKISVMESDVANLAVTSTAQTTDITNLTNALTSLQSTVNDKADLTEVESKLNTLETALEGAITSAVSDKVTVTQLATARSEIETSVSNLNAAYTAFKTSTETKISEINTAIATNKTAFDNFLTSYETYKTGVEGSLASLDSLVGTLRTDVDDNTSDIATNASNIASITTNLATLQSNYNTYSSSNDSQITSINNTISAHSVSIASCVDSVSTLTSDIGGCKFTYNNEDGHFYVTYGKGASAVTKKLDYVE